MASISKVANGYRAQVYVGGKRASAVRRTKREVEAWAAQKKVELRAQQEEPPASRVTLGEMLQRYADEVSVGKRGARWELLRVAAVVCRLRYQLQQFTVFHLNLHWSGR